MVLLRREFMYVNDFTDFFIMQLTIFLKCRSNQCWSWKSYSVLDYYKIVAKCLDWKGRFEFDKTKPVGQKQKSFN